MDQIEIENLAELMARDFVERLDDVILVESETPVELDPEAFQEIKDTFIKILNRLDPEDPRAIVGLRPTCVRCGGVGNKPHTCPYAEEIEDDYEATCTCCDECSHECLMDT